MARLNGDRWANRVPNDYYRTSKPTASNSLDVVEKASIGCSSRCTACFSPLEAVADTLDNYDDAVLHNVSVT